MITKTQAKKKCQVRASARFRPCGISSQSGMVGMLSHGSAKVERTPQYRCGWASRILAPLISRMTTAVTFSQ